MPLSDADLDKIEARVNAVVLQQLGGVNQRLIALEQIIATTDENPVKERFDGVGRRLQRIEDKVDKIPTV